MTAFHKRRNDLLHSFIYTVHMYMWAHMYHSATCSVRFLSGMVTLSGGR